LGINDVREVVGSSFLTGNTDFHAFLYSGGKMFDLNNALPKNSGWVLYSANSINDAGQVVGWGIFHGQQRAFELSPTSALGPLTTRVVLSGSGEHGAGNRIPAASAPATSKDVLGG